MKRVRVNDGKASAVTFFSLLSVLIFWWCLELVDSLLLHQSLNHLGIRPRELRGLVGVPLMPFLHKDIYHLMSNSVPFLILGYLVLKAEKLKFIYASVVITMVGGLGTWLIARSGTVHIGASGLIYGYFGYIMMRGFCEKKLRWILLAIIVGFVYGGLIFGALPTVGGEISWEGHLCGMLAGAWFGRSRALRKHN